MGNESNRISAGKKLYLGHYEMAAPSTTGRIVVPKELRDVIKLRSPEDYNTVYARLEDDVLECYDAETFKYKSDENLKLSDKNLNGRDWFSYFFVLNIDSIGRISSTKIKDSVELPTNTFYKGMGDYFTIQLI